MQNLKKMLSFVTLYAFRIELLLTRKLAVPYGALPMTVNRIIRTFKVIRLTFSYQHGALAICRLSHV